MPALVKNIVGAYECKIRIFYWISTFNSKVFLSFVDRMRELATYLPIVDPTWIFFVVLSIILFAPMLLSRLRIPAIVGMIFVDVVVCVDVEEKPPNAKTDITLHSKMPTTTKEMIKPYFLFTSPLHLSYT